MARYQFPGVEPGIPELSPFQTKRILGSELYYNEKLDTILFNSINKNTTCYPTYKNGLMNTIFKAYCHHTPLKLRPDDIWLSIVVVVFKYIDRNSDKFRKKLVDHEGQKELYVELNQDFQPDSLDCWLEATNQMSHLIQLETKVDLKKWSQPDFSTTTPKDQIITNIALMGGLKTIFSYGIGAACGLSEVILEGTDSDWLKLIELAQQLMMFEDDILTKWSELLIEVLKEFYNFYVGNVSEDFWQRICTHEARSSGPSKLRGWFVVFNPFEPGGKYILRDIVDIKKDHIYADMDDNEISNTQIDVTIYICTPREKFNVTLWGGVISTSYDPSQNILSPACDFVAIGHSAISFEIFKNIYMDNVLNSSYTPYRYSCYYLGAYDTIAQCAYYIAIKSHVPNHLLASLANTLHSNIMYISRDDPIPFRRDIIKKIYNNMAEPFSLYAPYVQTLKINELMKLFEEEYNEAQATRTNSTARWTNILGSLIVMAGVYWYIF
jgi:hypothetical protein